MNKVILCGTLAVIMRHPPPCVFLTPEEIAARNRQWRAYERTRNKCVPWFPSIAERALQYHYSEAGIRLAQKQMRMWGRWAAMRHAYRAGIPIEDAVSYFAIQLRRKSSD